jgi:hypothetical protein
MILFLLTFAFAVAMAAYAEGPGYTDRSVKVFAHGEEVGALNLRFYDGTPNIPYMGMNEYAQFLGRQPFSVQENGEGACELENWNGAKLICDAKEDRFFVQDWNAFFALPLPLEDRALGLKDMSVHFARITDITYGGEAAPVTIDFAKYGIELYSDKSDIYLPVSTLSNVMSDIATNHMLYNGENLYAQIINLNGSTTEGLFGSEMLQAQVRGEDRPEDIIKQCYADLCLNFDLFYGYPGKTKLEEALAEKGLDQALEGLGEDGQAIKAGLLSPSLVDYINAMTKLFFEYLSDGHTVFSDGVNMTLDPAVSSNSAFVEKIQSFYKEYMLNNPFALQAIQNYLIPIQRTSYWGEDTYREYGNTAIIRLDLFYADEAAWNNYYSNGGELPQDDFGIVVAGLKKASENPEIENVIFDLSCNGGGSPDMMMAILALTTGQDQLNGWNHITDQPMTITFEIDANFDGVYDEKDREVRYDYNYGVLVTRHAFSCGNLFPIIIQEAGAVLIGEPSSGGSCAIQIGSDAECMTYTLSSGQWHLMDSRGESVERGCSIDVPIEPAKEPITELPADPTVDSIADIIGKDAVIPVYQDYYDDARLDEIMNDWFGAQAQLDQAA